MTTATPPRALLTPSSGPRWRERAPAPGGHLLLGQHTQCETLGSGEGSCAPLRTPASRAAAGAPDARGRQPPNPRTGARLAQRRTAVVATHVTLANQAAVGAAEALLLPNVGERANDAVSGLGEPRIAALDRIEDHPAAGDVTGSRLPPPTGGLLAFPQGSLAPQARAGSDPESGKRGGNSRPWPGRPSGGWRGVTPSPTTRKNAGRGFAGLRAKRNGVTGFRQRRWMREAAKAAAKGGCCPLAATRRPRKLRNRRQKPCPARRCRRQILAGPVSADREPRQVREIAQAAIRAAAPAARPAVIPMAAGREGELRCDMFLTLLPDVRIAIPDHAAEVPAATPFAPGFPAVENVPHDVVTLFWRPRITSFRDNDLRDHHGGAEHRACRSGDRRSKPLRPRTGGRSKPAVPGPSPCARIPGCPETDEKRLRPSSDPAPPVRPAGSRSVPPLNILR